MVVISKTVRFAASNTTHTHTVRRRFVGKQFFVEKSRPIVRCGEQLLIIYTRSHNWFEEFALRFSVAAKDAWSRCLNAVLNPDCRDY